MRLTVVVPWRSRGDPDRDAACQHTVDYYTRLDIGPVVVAGDGRTGPFNRHAAYNRALHTLADDTVILWNEADTLIPERQIATAARLAADTPGLVVPYTERHELDATQTRAVYQGTNPFGLTGGYAVYRNGSSVGQAGVTHHETVTAVGGWDEQFEGWGYDDSAMIHVFATLTGPTRWVPGKGVHLWHKPEHEKPRTAHTTRNAQRCMTLLDIHDPADLRAALHQ